MTDTIIASIITTLLTAVLTYVGYWRHVEAELRKEYSNRLNQEKWFAYKNYLTMQSRVASVMKPESAEIKIALLLVASDGVVAAYNDMVSSFGDVEKRKSSSARLLAEIRKDLGYTSHVEPEELLKMFSSIQEP